MAFNQSCYGIRGKKGVSDTNFIYYALKNAVSQMLQVAYGGVFNTITRDTFKIIKTRLPHIKEQEAIACILGALDDKIEINRQMCKTLGETAQAIFKSWFVDFDPVHSKVTGKHSQGMNAEIVALFPDSFEDSEAGKIPKGWIISRLGDHFQLTMGQSPPGSTYNEDGIGEPFYQGRSDFGFRFPQKRVYCTAPTRYAAKGDTLVSVRAPVGDINMAIERCAIGRGVAAVRHINGSSIFTYYTMEQLRNNFNHFEAEGTVFGSITKGDFLNLPFVAPTECVIDRFESHFSVIESSIEVFEHESITLSSIRDTLLPRLISGDIRVKDAERIVGRTT
jgi:type I restriction enzyme S subunit